MKQKVVRYFCVLLALLQLPQTNSHIVKRAAVRSKLNDILGTNNIPDELTNVISALDSAMKILRCLPLRKVGQCYTPVGYCDVDTSEFTLEVKLTICKNPWRIRIDFKLPRELKKKVPGVIRRFVYVKVSPVIITLNHKKKEGITKVTSNSRIASAGFKLLGFRLGAFKLYFTFDLTVRWDCTRPTYDRKTRLKYNTAYSTVKGRNDMNKLYYKLNIGYKLMKKKTWSFRYRCSKCKTVLSKQGHFAEGPKSCKSDWGEWKPSRCSFFMRCEGMFQTRKCVGRSTGGPPCSAGSARRRCPAGGSQRPGKGGRLQCP